MIESLPIDAGDVVALRVHGKLTHEDYSDRILPRLERAIGEHGKVRCLCVLDEAFEGVTPGAVWDELKFDVAHRKDFERIAIVSDDRWVRVAVQMSRPFFGGEVRLFRVDERPAAEAWVQEGRAG